MRYMITDRRGGSVHIKDIDKALTDCANAIKFHEDRELRKKNGEEIAVYPEAHQYFRDMYRTLKNLKAKETLRDNTTIITHPVNGRVRRDISESIKSASIRTLRTGTL